MKTKIIAVVLKYDREYQELPGIIIDLFHIVHSDVVTKADSVHIITDISEDQDIQQIKRAFMQGIVDGNVLGLINYIRDRGYMIPYKRRTGWLLETIEKLIDNDTDRLLFYYTGHGQGHSIILPAGDCLMVTDFQRMLQRINMTAQGEIFMIFDCCQGFDLGLGYILNDQHWRQRSTNLHFQPNITLLNAAQLGQKTLTEINGSLFTRGLFQVINKERNIHRYSELLPWLQEQCSQHNSEQTCQIQTNNPLFTQLPAWIFGINAYLTIDKVHDIVIIHL